MAEAKNRNEEIQNHIESERERDEGHSDTRHENFECEEDPDEHLGCDLNIDVQG